MEAARTGLLVLVLIAGCATGPHRFRDQPATSASTDDWEACHAAASPEAQKAYARYEAMMDLGGSFGGAFGAPRSPATPGKSGSRCVSGRCEHA